MEDMRSQNLDSSPVAKSECSSNTSHADFKSRLKQFEYSDSSTMASQRRSPRVSSLRVGNSIRASSFLPQRGTKRRRLPHRLPDGDSNSKDLVCKELEDGDSNGQSTPPKLKKRRRTTKERAARDPHNPVNNLVDSIRTGLRLVMIGLNPGLMTAATGHAYAHPSNRFWHILHTSGITPKKHLPSETRDLMDLYEIGNTNICARPTRSGDGLTKQEMEEGAVILDEKIAKFRPEAVAIVGKSIWEAIWMMKKGQKKFQKSDFHWGWQDEDMQVGRVKDGNGNIIWPGAKTFVATSTSGLAATLTPAEKLAIWKPLGDWITEKRQAEASAGDHTSST